MCSLDGCESKVCVFTQGKTPKDKAQEAGDPKLVAYLDSHLKGQPLPHEDLETAV